MIGILNLAKPAGRTSRDVVDRVKRLVRPAKTGHAGTLDPLATGVLVVCVGPATRLISEIQESRKVYDATFLLGQTSPTDDLEGEVTHRPDVVPPTRADIDHLLPAFLGDIQQVPPQFSAVHVDGRRAYQLARSGETAELAAKTVTVTRLTIHRYAFPELDLEIECGSGTYIRSLARDLGERLRCGALMSRLVRTRIGPFTLDQALPLDELNKQTLAAALQPPLQAVADWPRCIASEEQLLLMRKGRRITLPGDAAWPHGARVAVTSAGGDLELLARVEIETRELAPTLVLHGIG